MSRQYLAVIVLGACGFSPTLVQNEQADAQPAATADGGGVLAAQCHVNDPDLRLCLDFEDPALDPTVADRSTLHHDGAATLVTPMLRAGQQAAGFTYSSSVHVAETPDLDVATNLTYELWISVADPSETSWPFDNYGEYAIGLDEQELFCYAAGSYVHTHTDVPLDTWHHVACTYGNGQLRAYLDGKNVGCTNTHGQINAGANTDGINIGAQHTGGLDDVHVYARLFDQNQVANLLGITPAPLSPCTQD